MRTPTAFSGCSMLLVAVCLLFSSANKSLAQKPPVQIPGAPHLLPIDTLAYIRFDNADELRQDFAETSVAKMLRDPELRPLVSDTYQTLAQLFEEFGSELGITLDELLAIPSGQIAAAAVPGNLSPEQINQVEQIDQVEGDKDDESREAIEIRLDRKRRNQNSVSGWFMIDAGDNVGKLRELLAKLEQKLQSDGYVQRTTTVDKTRLIRWLPPRPGRPEIEFFEKDKTIVLGIGHATASKSLEFWNDDSDEKSFADRADFAAIMSRCLGAEETRPQMTFFVDPYQLIGRFVKRNAGAAFFWPLVEELGFNKIRGFGGSSFQGGKTFEAISHFHVLVDAPRDGFFGVLRPETGDTMPPPWVPDSVTSYTSLNWDFDRAYTNLDKIIAKFRGPQPLKSMIEDPVRGAIDVVIPDEIKNTLGGRYVVCRWVEPPIKINSGVQMHALSLKDPERAQEILSKIRSRYPQRMKVDSVAGQTLYVIEPRRRRNRPDSLRTPEPGMIILNDWLIFSDSRKFLESAIRASTGSQPRLLNNLEFELVASELGGKLGGEDPFMISFLRGADYLRQAYELARSDDTRKFLRKRAEKNQGAQKAIDLLSRNELPPFEKFEKYFAPSGTFAYDEPAGMHFGSFTLRADQKQ
ncbi:hypothetical protein LF1_21630 [Rubripirellula obstinata]|uniref:DUF3352 domain-containing protein n=1 Tax=Rubripirellula obstinata TaxID=406547 RepID=A0A5B1CEQ1_9BACT|nr:hypothetical protein [Rubripirellula obstinata]KAA1259628.1 hypothetical protein LF1_21630 [Rubripirellula obstinata]